MVRARYGDKPRVLARLEIEYEDGGGTSIVTDGSWKAAYGPILEADLLMGETYDARKELNGWSQRDFDDSKWQSVAMLEEMPAIMEAHPGAAVRRMEEIRPVRITEPRQGRYTFDMGQNFAGWARMKVSGRAGDEITMRFAERLNPDGTVYTTNLRHARCIDTYICKGEPVEMWEPSFTYHGFQYVEVTGLREKPALDTVTGIVVHSDTPRVGHFECSNVMINKLYSNIVWGQKSNFLEVPTDCPQRDERLGWTGDAQIFIGTAVYNMDVSAFFTKWLGDMEDAQAVDGAFQDVAPNIGVVGAGVSGWGDAGVVCPWTIWKTYGDRRVVEGHYQAMKKWLDHLRDNSNGCLRPPKGFGDWLSIGEETPKDVIGTAYFAYSAKLLSEMAAAIGKQDDSEKYGELFKEIKAAFNRAYVSEDGKIKGDTQTVYVLALYFGLLDNEKSEQAAQHLVKAIERRDWHLSTGFLGLSYLCPVLTQTGNLDIAYRLLNSDTFPSWLYPVKNGATTIWERWDGWTEENGFQDPGMNSFNHYAYGSVGQWLFTTVAGIAPAEPGYKKVVIHPLPGGGITWVNADYSSIRGRIAARWEVLNGKFQLDVTIPPNTQAEVYMPGADKGAVREGGRPVSEAEGVEFLREETDALVYRILSGDYSFEASYTPSATK